MSEKNYKKLAKVLDTLPNGFPSTESGLEIKILKKIFNPEEAELFCDLRLKFETSKQVAERTGRDEKDLDEKLFKMWHKGQIFGINLGGTKLYKMVPWVLGIYEYQVNRMDRELAELSEKYHMVFGKQFFENKPQLMQVIPIEEKIPNPQEALTFEKVSKIIEKGQSFAVNDCICKKEKHLLDNGCDKPLEVCLAIAPVPGIFDDHPLGKHPITKEEAYEVLRKSEEAGLVHLAANMADGQNYICNCCGCCCGVLQGINEFGINSSVNAHYYAVIDEETCSACGVCADERCQIAAIEEGDNAYSIIKEKCIGCGLCITTCPSESITLIRKEVADIVAPPTNENEWFDERGRLRGVDFSDYK